LLSTYSGQARDLAPWLAGAQLNRDSNLRLQYLAGFGLNMYQSSAIYSQMLHYRKFPDDLFVGGGAAREQLRTLIEAPREEP
jgi:spermidine synthase